jgi:serine/threonine protein kinase
MVMELMRASVADVLRKGEPIAHDRALRWLHEAAGALDTAHEAGVVHRDIKPANLLLDERDRLAVADYGIARLAWEEQVTQTGQVLGTAAYISPEQAMGHPAVAASDRYALAVVAFELLTGRKPFSAEHFAAQARAHVEDDPPRASELVDGLNPDVDRVLAKGLAKDPEDRWASAEEFVDRLDEALNGHHAPAAAAAGALVPETVATRHMSEADPTPPPSSPAPRRETPPPPGGRGPGVLLAVLAGLLLLGVLAFVLLSSGGDSNKGSTNSASKTATPPKKTAKKTPTATPAAAATQTAAPTAATTPAGKAPAGKAPAGNDPTQLQLQAFRLNNAGKPDQALPYAQKAVSLSCKGSAPVSPCGYALFELAKAQRQTGDPKAAIKTLQDRQRRYPSDQKAAVDAELAKAKSDAGQG